MILQVKRRVPEGAINPSWGIPYVNMKEALTEYVKSFKDEIRPIPLYAKPLGEHDTDGDTFVGKILNIYDDSFEVEIVPPFQERYKNAEDFRISICTIVNSSSWVGDNNYPLCRSEQASTASSILVGGILKIYIISQQESEGYPSLIDPPKE